MAHKLLILPRYSKLGASSRYRFYDSLDRFGTRLENRYSKQEILEIFNNSGFIDVQFSDRKPY